MSTAVSYLLSKQCACIWNMIRELHVRQDDDCDPDTLKSLALYN